MTGFTNLDEVTHEAAGTHTRENVVVDNLSVSYRVRDQERLALRNLSLTINAGESYGLVGESGCGKSTFANTLIRYLSPNGRVAGGSVRVAGTDILAAKGEALRKLRADSIAMVYQSPGRALNPTMKIGKQLAESYVVRGAPWAQAHDSAIAMLRRVQIADPELVMERYPRELSGGMQQRVVIGMALAKDPELLILDEPTTGLDATVEAEVLELIATLQRDMSTSLLFISHNLSIVSEMCDRVGILYAGRLVEEGPTATVFANPQHPYTASLLGSLPRPGMEKASQRLVAIPGSLPRMGDVAPGCIFQTRCPLVQDRCRTEEPPVSGTTEHSHRCYFPEKVPDLSRATPAPVAVAAAADERTWPVILDAKNVNKTYGSGESSVQVLTGVNLELRAGETLGLVGESGSGKSTLARVLVGLAEPDNGSELTFRNQELKGQSKKRTAEQLRAMQIVFQNPDTALNEQHSIRRIISRSARTRKLSRKAQEELIAQLAQHVRLPLEMLSSRPNALSGGMKQRVAVARAFASAPEIVVLDEPTSALDVSVQAAILNLLLALQDDSESSYLFISHDLAVVRYISDRVLVMYLGRVMESGRTEDVFAPPFHPYTEALLSTASASFGERKPERIRLDGDPPSVANPPTGCVFNTRCPRKVGSICETEAPPVQELPSGQTIRCHIPFPELKRMQSADRGSRRGLPLVPVSSPEPDHPQKSI